MYTCHGSMNNLRKLIKKHLIEHRLKDQLRNFKVIKDPNNLDQVICILNPNRDNNEF